VAVVEVAGRGAAVAEAEKLAAPDGGGLEPGLDAELLRELYGFCPIIRPVLAIWTAVLPPEVSAPGTPSV
jgi:hypothetical protein